MKSSCHQRRQQTNNFFRCSFLAFINAVIMEKQASEWKKLAELMKITLDTQ